MDFVTKGIYSLACRFYYKLDNFDILRNRTGVITKWGSFSVLQSGATGTAQ